MRWMWIDRVLELEPGRRLVAVKCVSLAEEHLHDHFEARPAAGALPPRDAAPVMPASLVLEGMAQSAGILVGHAEDFREKVILAKVSRAEFLLDAVPGRVIRYTAEADQITPSGATARVEAELLDPATGAAEPLGRSELIFSHLDQNMGGQKFPEHNFVFGEGFRTLLRMSGVAVPA